jgi:NADPH2:quinone reductase
MPTIPATMKAVMLMKPVNRYSEGEEAVRQCFQVVTDAPTPKPRFSQVLIKLQRAQINPSDTSFCQGRYGIKRDPPCVPGFEGCGVVVAHGGSPLAWRLMHKRVSFFCTGGAWAEYVAVDQSRCLVVSENVLWKNAAGGVTNPLTVMEMIRVAEHNKHTCMVATAASSSLTQQLIRVGKTHGISTIAIVRKAEQIGLGGTAGAVVTLNSSDENFVA